MRPGLDVETSIVTDLAARPSHDLIAAARQQMTHVWWRERRPTFDVFVSQVVLDEIRGGDPDAAERRAALVAGLPVLDITPKWQSFAAALIQGVPLPLRPGANAAHIAAAAYHRIGFLMTWNSTGSVMGAGTAPVLFSKARSARFGAPRSRSLRLGGSLPWLVAAMKHMNRMRLPPGHDGEPGEPATDEVRGRMSRADRLLASVYDRPACSDTDGSILRR